MALRKFYTSHKSSSSSCDRYIETMSNLRDFISHCGGAIGNHPLLVEKFLKAADTTEPLNPTEDETATSKTATEEAYMATEFLSGINNAMYGVLINKLHNTFHMGREEYLKTLTSAYDLEINWKGDTKGVGVTSNDGTAFTTESEEADVHAKDGMKMKQTENPVICHICDKNHYTNRCTDREDGTTGKKADKDKDNPIKETPPTKTSVNLTIREDWEDCTNYGGLVLYQVTAGTAVEQHHALSQSGGHINTTWILLDNQSIVDVFSNIRLLKNIRKSNRSLAIFSTR